MTTTGELRAIIEELELVDIGEAASYLGEDAATVEEPVDTTATKLATCLGSLINDERFCRLR